MDAVVVEVAACTVAVLIGARIGVPGKDLGVTHRCPRRVPVWVGGLAATGALALNVAAFLVGR